jgi:hypothetical protein
LRFGPFTDLRRIADALERAFPPVAQDDTELKPEDAVTYVDEEKMARQEQVEAESYLEQLRAEHPEFFEQEADDLQPEDSRKDNPRL